MGLIANLLSPRGCGWRSEMQDSSNCAVAQLGIPEPLPAKMILTSISPSSPACSISPTKGSSSQPRSIQHGISAWALLLKSPSTCRCVAEGKQGLPCSPPDFPRDLGAAQAVVSLHAISTGKSPSPYSCLPCTIIFSLAVINTFNQNERVLLLFVNNANAMQTFHCLLLSISA